MRNAFHIAEQAQGDAPNGLIQSVQRAVQLLKAFDNGSGELGVSELSRTIGLAKSTVSRLLSTLEHEGLIEHVPGSDKYRLGFLIMRLAGRVTHFGDVRSAAHAALLALSERSLETVHLAVIDGDEVVNIEQLAAPHLVRETNWIGRRTPFHCASNGKALLAFQPEAMIERILIGPLPRYTAQTITDPDQIRAELAKVRTRGYALALGEVEAGLNGISAPIRDAQGAVIAAVSVSGPAYRISATRLADLVPLVIAAAADIAARLGYVEKQAI